MSHLPRRLCGGLVTTVAVSAVVASAAQAEVVGDSVAANHNVGIFHNLDFVAAFGDAPLTPTTVQVTRDGQRIGYSSGLAANVGEFPAPNEGGLEVNHGPEAAPVDGDCWVTFTPDIIPGDHVTVTRAGVVEEVIVDDITIDEGPFRDANGDVVLRGTAALANGTPIPIARLDSGEVRNTSRFRGAPTSVFRTPGTAAGWTMVYDVDVPLERENDGPFTREERAALLMAGDHAMGYGHVAPLPTETQLFEGTETPGPAPGCAPPSHSNAVASADDTAINRTSGDLVVQGTAMAGTLGVAGALDPDGDITGATVTASDGVNAVTAPATGDFGGTGQSSWTATFSRAQLDGLRDGPITVSAAFATSLGTLGGKTLSLTKDVVAPVVTADPAPGTYTGLRSVSLAAGPGERITYRTDGGTPSSGDTAYAGPIALGFGSTSLGVRAEDPAGNVTTQVLGYTINRPATAALPGSVVAQATRPRTARMVASTRRSLRLRLRSVRRSGLRATFVAPDGARVAVARLYRVRGAVRTLLATKRLSVRAGRRRTVRFAGRNLRPGRYLVVLRVGGSRSTLGPAVNVRVRIVR